MKDTALLLAVSVRSAGVALLRAANQSQAFTKGVPRWGQAEEAAANRGMCFSWRSDMHGGQTGTHDSSKSLGLDLGRYHCRPPCLPSLTGQSQSPSKPKIKQGDGGEGRILLPWRGVRTEYIH